MSRATATALTVLRVARGAPHPSEAELRAALQNDRGVLAVADQPLICDFAVAGPYAIVVDGKEMDEYVVWER